MDSYLPFLARCQDAATSGCRMAIRGALCCSFWTAARASRLTAWGAPSPGPSAARSSRPWAPSSPDRRTASSRGSSASDSTVGEAHYVNPVDRGRRHPQPPLGVRWHI